MVKHNNPIHSNHFHKDWQSYVRTWFDQPARKLKRRIKRVTKAAALFPRPTNFLRPIVHCPTNQHNMKIRPGRGFTIDELIAAGIDPRRAYGLRICIDKRRTNKSKEAFDENVERLKSYNSRIIILDKNMKPAQIQNKYVYTILFYI